MSSLYKHLEFSDPAKQIRLLRLESSPTRTDEYAFSLKVHDFQENSRPSYIAISYTWGLPTPKLPVVINGLRMRVQFNCWYALWQMRHHGYTSDVNFWIDSLCINQGNDEEKGHQVAMMGEIFASASSVAASIGTGESLGNVQEILASGNNREIRKLRGRFDQLPYFDRVWIKQEIVLAKDINIFYGLERLSWGQFDQAVWNSQRDNSNLLENPFRLERLEKHSVSIQLCNHRSQVTKTSTLMDLVVKYGTAKASVAADKIYALLSLLPRGDPMRRNLSITYGEATSFPLFQNLVRLLYSHYQCKDVGIKHSVLRMICDSLGICGLDDDVGAFLESQVCHPLDPRSFHTESATIEICCLHVLNDENSRELKPKDLRVDMNQEEPHVVRKLGLSGRLHIPPQLKSLRTLYNFTDPEPFLLPARSELFLVDCDVRPGDLLGTLAWDAHWHDTKWRGDYAHVILRRTSFVDESESQDYDVPLDKEAKRRRTAFCLHSWAIPLREKFTMLSELDRTQPLHVFQSTKMVKATGRLRLHYHDALVPLLLNHYPLQSLLYSKSVLSSGAINLSSRVEDPEDIVERLEEGRDSEYGGGECRCRDIMNDFSIWTKLGYDYTQPQAVR